MQSQQAEKPKRKYTFKTRRTREVDLNQRMPLSPEVVNTMTIKHSDIIIRMAEREKKDLMVEQSKLDEELKIAKEYFDKAKLAYDEVQSKYDAFGVEIKEREAIIKYQIHIKSGRPLDKIKMNTVESNADTQKAKKMYPKFKSPRIHWIGHAEKVLEKSVQFMSGIELMTEILKDDAIRTGFEKQKKHDKAKINKIANDLHLSSRLPIDNNKRQSKLKEYDGKIGLIDWFNTEGELRIEFIKQFMRVEQPQDVVRFG